MCSWKLYRVLYFGDFRSWKGNVGVGMCVNLAPAVSIETSWQLQPGVRHLLPHQLPERALRQRLWHRRLWLGWPGLRWRSHPDPTGEAVHHCSDGSGGVQDEQGQWVQWRWKLGSRSQPYPFSDPTPLHLPPPPPNHHCLHTFYHFLHLPPTPTPHPSATCPLLPPPHPAPNYLSVLIWPFPFPSSKRICGGDMMETELWSVTFQVSICSFLIGTYMMETVISDF